MKAPYLPVAMVNGGIEARLMETFFIHLQAKSQFRVNLLRDDGTTSGSEFLNQLQLFHVIM